MDRRAYLRAIGAVSAVGLAGCTGDDAASSDRTATATQSSTGRPATATETPTPEYGSEEVPDWLPVPLEDLRRGAPRNAIPAIRHPEFAEDWSGLVVNYDRAGDRVRIEPRLDPGDEVIGVERDGRARAYPLRVLNWHEVVNDDFGGPLLVTYCPLCGSGVVADRSIGGEPTEFGVSGLLYRSNLVMFDRETDSLWSQLEAIAIRGPRTGRELDLIGSTLTTLGEWRSAHPETRVLLPPPASSTIRGNDEMRNYNADPYAGYGGVGLGREEYDDRIHPKTTVLGVVHDDVAVAYPLPTVRDQGGLVTDTVAGLPVVVAATPDDSLVAYDRRLDGRTLAFERDGDVLRAGGSTWELLTGAAVDGPFEGRSLERANDRSPLFWFAWADLHPDSEIYGR